MKDGNETKLRRTEIFDDNLSISISSADYLKDICFLQESF